jgi:hypothetical protein
MKKITSAETGAEVRSVHIFVGVCYAIALGFPRGGFQFHFAPWRHKLRAEQALNFHFYMPNQHAWVCALPGTVIERCPLFTSGFPLAVIILRVP